MEIIQISLSLIIKSLVLSARWASLSRRNQLFRSQSDEELQTIINALNDKIEKQEVELELLRKQIKKSNTKPRYTIREKLMVLWYMKYFDVPRCQITKRLVIAKFTLYQWLKEFDSFIKDKREPVNKTPNELARLVWSIHKSNPDWGRHRISLQIALLGVFLSASTVRNILSRPYPPTNKKSNSEKTNEKQEETNPNKAKHSNHVWSIDRTVVKRWGIWNTYMLVGIDHHSRKIVCCAPLEGPNAGWTIDVFESSIQRNGIPKYLISDHESVFRSEAFAECVRKHGIQHRFGAVGKHGSIAVTERAIKTLKYEWIHRVHVIWGYRHLDQISKDFEEWYNCWRPHTTVQGTPEVAFQENQSSQLINKDSKIFQLPIEQKYFQETRVSGFRLKEAAQ